MKNGNLQLKIKNFLLRFWSIVFLLVIWFVFSFPYFFQHKVPYPSTYQVNHFHPWSDYEKFWGPVKNGAMPDIVDQIYPWKHFTISMLKKGQIALWNPYSFAGNPHLANVQSATLSPFNLLFFFLPFVDAWSMLVLLQPLLSGIFIYIFLRELKISMIGSTLGGVTFMFCGFVVTWMAYGTLSMAITFLPLALYSIQKVSESKQVQWKFLLLLGFTIAASFFSGHFQTSIYFATYSLLFILFKLITAKIKKNVVLALLFFIFGVVISLLQILPSVQFYQKAVRSEIFIQGGGIPWYYLVTSFAPDFFGNPVTRNTWFGHYAEWASFIGIIPIVLALFAFRKKNTMSVFFFISGIIMLLLAVDTPIHGFLSSLKIPVLSTSIPSRIIMLFSFSFAALAGFGFDHLREMIVAKSVRRVVATIVITGLVLLGIWILLLVSMLPQEYASIARKNFILPTILFAVSVFVIFFSFARKKLIYALIVLLLFASFDSLRFAQKWMPFDPKELVFPDVPVINAIKENIGSGRVFGNIRAQVDTYYEIPSIEGYDPLYIQRYGEFVRSAAEGLYMSAERSVVQLDRRGKYIDKLLDLLGVTLIFHPAGDTYQGWAYPVWGRGDRYERIYRDDKFELYRNKAAMSRAMLFYDYVIVKEKEKILKTFYSPEFDFRKRVILEERMANMPGDRETKNEGKAEILLYSPNKILISVTTKTSAILFLSDNYYPTWKASVNGKEEKIYRADYTFRAVLVPAGESVVEFANKFIL